MVERAAPLSDAGVVPWRWPRAGALMAFALALVAFVACRATGSTRTERSRLVGLAAMLPPQPLRWTGAVRRDDTNERAAVVIAADRYPGNPEWDLPGAAASAEQFATALASYCGVAGSVVEMLRGEGAHRDAVFAAIARAGDSARGPRALLIVYYAGHGFVDADGDPALFTPFTRAAPGGGFEGTLARRDLVRAVTQARAAASARDVELEVVFVIDACRVGVAAPPPRARLVQAPLWELWATRPGTYARADGEGPFTFTGALCVGMETLAQAGGEVDLGRVAEEARVRTRLLTAARQDPELRPPKVGAEPPVLIVREGVVFHVASVDALSFAYVPNTAVRCGERVFPSDSAAGVRVVLPSGQHLLSTNAVGYLGRTDFVDVRPDATGDTLELRLYPELVLVEGRVVPPAIVAVRARGLASNGRENYHLTRTVTDRDGAFRLRLPGLRRGAELEFVAAERIAATVALPERAERTQTAAPGVEVGFVELEVQLEAGPAAQALTQVSDAVDAPPDTWPTPLSAADAAALERARELVGRGRFDMARDALESVPVGEGEVALQAQWSRWLDIEAARRGPLAIALARLRELAAREDRDGLRLAIAEQLVRNAIEARDADGLLDIAEAAAVAGLDRDAKFMALQSSLLPPALDQVLREGLASGTATDDWRRADRALQFLLDARYLWVIAARPSLAELTAEVRRERVPAACRLAFARGEAAFADGRLELARQCYVSALAEANEHYRGRIEERLAVLDERVYAHALDDGTRCELEGRLGAALEAYARAYARNPRARESLRRVLRQRPGGDEDFANQYRELRDRFVAAAEARKTAAAWSELCDLFGNDPRARELLRARLIDAWAEVVDAGDSATGLPRRVRERRTGIEMLLVEPGRFAMGAPDTDPLANAVERPRHSVTLTAPFYLAETEVTWQVWRRFAPEAGANRNLEALSAQHPVAGISWEEAQWFCAHLRLRLPTEAEWEYACVAGGADYRRYASSDDPAAVTDNVRRADEGTDDREVFPGTDGYPDAAPVGTGAANAWGFKDMLGNVREWVADGFLAKAYQARRGAAEDPFVPPAADATAVVVRGGSYRDGPRAASAVARFEARADAHLPWIGLRVARSAW